MEKDSKIFIAGHRGMVGSAILRNLESHGYHNFVLRNHSELDLINQAHVHDFFNAERPEYVFVAAAKVGGILYNSTYQADFLYENMMIALNVMHAAHQSGVEKLLFLGSSCIYPRAAEQPIREEYLLTGPLEPTNEGYALAKISGLKLCEKFQMQYGERFISAMPTNLYGLGDNYHPKHSHVIPGLLRRFHEAKVRGADHVEVWGSGKPRREFLNVDDLAEALRILMMKYEDHSTVNVGTGEDIEIIELAETVKRVVGFEGEIKLDTSKPDGMMRKVLDISKMKSFGWEPKIALENGLSQAYEWALEHGRLS